MDKFSKIESFIDSLDRNSLDDEQQALLLAGGQLISSTSPGGTGNNCECNGNNCDCTLC